MILRKPATAVKSTKQLSSHRDIHIWLVLRKRIKTSKGSKILCFCQTITFYLGSEEILSSSPAVLAIPRSRAAQRESIRNIKTTLSTRKKNFLHLHNTGFKPQSKSEKEQNIAPTPMPRRKVRVASIKKDEVIKQEAISELIASEDKNIASKEKKVPPKKPPRKLRVSVKRVSTRKSTKGGEIKCKKAGESGERGSTNTIDNGEQRRVSSRQSIKFTESGGKSVSSTNADLYTNGNICL